MNDKIKKNIITGTLIGSIIISSGTLYKVNKDIKKINSENNKYNKIMAITDEEIIKSNDKVIKDIIDSSILVTNSKTSYTLKYTIIEDNLYDESGNKVILTNSNIPIYFVNCNLSNKLLENIDLVNSISKNIYLDSSNIDNAFVYYLPNTTEELSLAKCNYITSLADLPKQCPNIKVLNIDNMPSLSDLSFIYELSNLKAIYLKESAYITEELLTYLNNNNIITNITKKDIYNNIKTNEIINNIISNEMTDKEKIKTIITYVTNNMEYDITRLIDSNNNPLTCAINDNVGVCTSYSYLTNILLNKAQITSFEIINENHAWNILKLDDNYYYIDPTNIDNNNLYNNILSILNIDKFYFVNPNNSETKYKGKPTDDLVIIPEELINAINNQDILTIDKYNNIDKRILICAGLLSGITIYLYNNKRKQHKKLNNRN